MNNIYKKEVDTLRANDAFRENMTALLIKKAREKSFSENPHESSQSYNKASGKNRRIFAYAAAIILVCAATIAAVAYNLNNPTPINETDPAQTDAETTAISSPGFNFTPIKRQFPEKKSYTVTDESDYVNKMFSSSDFGINNATGGCGDKNPYFLESWGWIYSEYYADTEALENSVYNDFLMNDLNITELPLYFSKYKYADFGELTHESKQEYDNDMLAMRDKFIKGIGSKLDSTNVYGHFIYSGDIEISLGERPNTMMVNIPGSNLENANYKDIDTLQKAISKYINPAINALNMKNTFITDIKYDKNSEFIVSFNIKERPFGNRVKPADFGKGIRVEFDMIINENNSYKDRNLILRMDTTDYLNEKNVDIMPYEDALKRILLDNPQKIQSDIKRCELQYIYTLYSNIFFPAYVFYFDEPNGIRGYYVMACESKDIPFKGDVSMLSEFFTYNEGEELVTQEFNVMNKHIDPSSIPLIKNNYYVSQVPMFEINDEYIESSKNKLRTYIELLGYDWKEESVILNSDSHFDTCLLELDNVTYTSSAQGISIDLKNITVDRIDYNAEYIDNLLKTNKQLAAAAAYLGIKDAQILKIHYSSESDNYWFYVIDKDSPSPFIDLDFHSIYVTFTIEGGISFHIYDKETTVANETPLYLSYKGALDKLYSEIDGIKPDDILACTIKYSPFIVSGYYVPCYEFYLKSGETPETDSQTPEEGKITKQAAIYRIPACDVSELPYAYPKGS